MNMCNSWFERWWLGAATTSERTSRRASTTSGSLASASPISGIPCSKETTPATFLSSSCLGQPAGSETTLSGAFTYACLVLVLVLVLMLALCWFPWRQSKGLKRPTNEEKLWHPISRPDNTCDPPQGAFLEDVGGQNEPRYHAPGLYSSGANGTECGVRSTSVIKKARLSVVLSGGRTHLPVGKLAKMWFVF